ncbi:MAG: hypothetical protein HZB55_16565 [Deltaproteobacteria bacterium]|nr:hypothetical protein [Deltaproteobacteria bacterium]
MSSRPFCALAALLLCLLLGPPAGMAASDRWEPYPPADAARGFPGGGPWGGWVRRLTSPAPAAGTTLWAATAGGVFVSTDGGAHWTARSEGLGSRDVSDVAVCAAAPAALIASTQGAGLYLSSSAGRTWSRVPPSALPFTGQARDFFAAVGISPRTPSHLLAGTSDGVGDLLLVSTDGGITWTVAQANTPVSRIVFAADGDAFVATLNGRLFRVDFPDPAVPLPPLPGVSLFGALPTSAPVVDLSLPGGDGTRVLASQGGAGLWRSTFDGSNWSAWADVGRPTALQLCLGCPECDNCAADPYVAAALEIDAVASHPAQPDRIWFHVYDPAQGKQSGLYESTDLGATFTASTLPERGQEVWSLLAAGSSLWLGESKAGAFRLGLPAGGWTWASDGLAAFDAFDLDFDPVSPGALAVSGGGSPTLSGNGGMVLWSPSGGNWVRRPGDLHDEPGTFPASTTSLVRYRGSELWLSTVPRGLYSSADGGLTWAPHRVSISGSSEGILAGLAFAPGDPAAGVAGTMNAVFSTADGGLTWVWNDALGAPTWSQGWLVRVDPRLPRGFAVAGSEGFDGRVYATEDGGTTWNAAGTLPGRQIVSFATAEQDPGRWLAGTASDGLYGTLQGGDEWSRLTGLPQPGTASAVAAGRTADPVLAVALKDRGVFVTADGGAHWKASLGGLSGSAGGVPVVRGIFFEPGTGRLLAAVQNRGLWSLDPPFRVADLSVAGGSAFTASRQVSLGLSGAAPGVARVRFRNEGGEWDAWRPYASTVSWVLSEGQGTKTVFAEFGTTAETALGQATARITLGSIRLDWPNDGAVTGYAPQLAYTVSDPSAAVAVFVDDKPVAQRAGEPLAALGEGTHRVRVEVSGGPGGTASDRVVFTVVDRVPPTITIQTPSDGVQTSAAPSLEYTVSDGTARVIVDDGLPASLPSGSVLGPLADGLHTVWIEAVDAAGNVGRAFVTFTVALTPADGGGGDSGGGGGGGGGGGCFLLACGGAGAWGGWFAAAVIAVLLLGPAPVRAAGPFGGSVTGLALDAEHNTPRWAATWRGLFRFDGGRWSRVDALKLMSLSAVLDLGGRVGVVAVPGTVLWSEDDGATWSAKVQGLEGRYGRRVDDVLTVEADPRDPSHVVLGAAGQGPFESRDSGRSWHLLLPGLEEAPPPAFHPAALLTAEGERPLLMGTDGAGLYAWRSGRWESTGEGLPPRLRVQRLAGDPRDPKKVALGARGDGLWTSRDGGLSWTLARKGTYGIVDAVAFGAAGALLSHFSEDGAVVVSEGGPGPVVKELREAQVLALEARAEGGWFAGVAHDGIARLSSDGTLAGSEVAGLDATRVGALVGGDRKGALWCGDSNGVFSSSDEGATWQARDKGLLGASIDALLWHKGALFAGSGGQGVYRWAPEKEAWEDRSAGLGTANTIFALVEDASRERLYVGTEGGLLRSDDGAASWVHKDTGLAFGPHTLVAASARKPGLLWASTGGRVYRSEDAGESWAVVAERNPVALLTQTVDGAERLWVLDESRLAVVSDGELTAVPLTPRAGERFTTLVNGSDGLWVGSSAGLWALADGRARRVWEGAGVLAIRPTETGLLIGTDGRGVVPVEDR